MALIRPETFVPRSLGLSSSLEVFQQLLEPERQQAVVKHINKDYEAGTRANPFPPGPAEHKGAIGAPLSQRWGVNVEISAQSLAQEVLF